jgi:hypothetical protein
VRQWARCVHQRILCPLERQADIDKRAHGLHAIVVLGMVQEVPLTALVCGVPVEDVEMGSRRIAGN